jgi:enterochelin esterase-like enzyme
VPDIREIGDWSKGSVVRFDHASEVLAGNPWNDPAQRPLHVYLPAEYSESGPAYPALWDLAAFTNSGPGHLAWRNHGENLPARLDRLIGQNKMPPVVVVFPDCYTSLGGNQYVNSASVGAYADYLVGELVPFVSEQVNVVNHRDGRGLFGKSSGGFGALHHAMHFNETWGAIASHAGDVGFELVYRPAFADTCSVLADHGHEAETFIRNFWKKNRPSGKDFTALMTLAMAASYDPDPDKPERIRLPFDLRTCELDEDRWTEWLSFDPLHQVESHAEALNNLHAFYIDVGKYDQYQIQYGTRQMVAKMQNSGINFQYEEFKGSHSSIDWRLDISLPMLASALKKALTAAI